MIIYLVHSLFCDEARCLNLEGQYLLDVKSRVVDDFNNLGDWNPMDSTPCGWIGVSCGNDNINPVVKSLDLSRMNLSGSISPSIGGLAHLIHLDLSFNGFFGSIPKEIGNCSNLQSLSLRNNHLIGPFPQELGKLSALTYRL